MDLMVSSDATLPSLKWVLDETRLEVISSSWSLVKNLRCLLR